jgi:TatD DNase family protein
MKQVESKILKRFFFIKISFQHLEPNHKIHLHCFVGTIEDVQLFTSYFTEIKFGFTPLISRGNFLHTVIQQIDLTKILCETDSPYFVPDEVILFN